MKEYGGYLEWEELEGSDYYPDYLRFDAIRSALNYVVQKRGYRKVWIPYYLCGCIRETLTAMGMPYECYFIRDDFCPDISKELSKDDCVFVVNYFGQLSNSVLVELKQKYTNIFVDNTHAFFREPVPGVDTGYTCRKYFGVPDGAYLSTDLVADDFDELPYDISFQRMQYIMGRYETDSNSHYQDFVKNDLMFRGVPAKKMSRLVKNILSGLDYQTIIQRRKDNFSCLHNALKGKNQLTVCNEAGLFLYPFLCDDGAEIKKRLIEKKIYVPTFWPEVLDSCSENSWEYQLTKKLVLLPMDQRYNRQDMEYILDVITAFI